METAAASAPGNESAEVRGPARESYGKLFLRFLRFGCLAWGGPVAQIDMIRQELVEEERWVSKVYFKKLLAIYQVLPGPEAHELCVYFGMLARGRLGGVVAGLAFMLPGFLLMFLFSWLYVAYRITEGPMQAVFLGIQPAVIALIFRASHRIGTHVVTDRALFVIAVASGIGDLLGVPFWMTLPAGGCAYLLAAQKRFGPAIILGMLFVVAAVLLAPETRGSKRRGKVRKLSCKAPQGEQRNPQSRRSHRAVCFYRDCAAVC
jgi:chromate transporter